MRIIAALAIGLLSCGGSSSKPTPTPTPTPAPTPAGPSVETLAKDTELTLAGVVTFSAPAGWAVRRSERVIELTAPEGDLTLALVAVEAPGADAAIEAAWKTARMAAGFPVKLSQPLPGRDGWLEGRSVQYDIPPDQKVAVGASAFRGPEGWAVLLLKSSEATLDKRRAALGQIGGSARPAGHAKESFAKKQRHRLQGERLAELETFVETAREALDVPGVALAVYDGGELVTARGFGVRELGKKATVDADTLFMVASNTKPLTTLMLATLVDEGKLTWDTPVIERWPAFKLGDPETTKSVLFRHLVCACTGLPRQDLEWLFEFKDATPASTLEILATMKPTTKFGETFQYSNPLASAAGYAGAHVVYPKLELGAAYDKAMQRRVFDPLGMKTATFNYKRALARNHASPHSRDADGVVRLASMDFNRSIHPLRPAGALWASANDMMKYLRMELASGKLPGGKTLISEAALLERRKEQVSTGSDRGYGMGLGIDTEYQIPIFSHGGSMLGFKSNMYFLPEHDVAAVVLTNADSGGLLPGAVLRKMLELMFDGRPEALEDVNTAAARLEQRIAKERALMTIPPDPAVVARLARRYKSDALGTLVVKKSGDKVIVDVGEWRSPVATREADNGAVALITTAPGLVGFEFVVTTRDGKRALTTRSMQHEYVFIEAQ